MFWYLTLAHLLGDYPFQPNWLVMQKRHTWALLLHGVIHFLFMFGLVGQLRLQVLPQLLALTIAHVIVDATKTSLSTKGSLSTQTSYLLDQAIHLALIGVTATWINAGLSDTTEPLRWGWSVILSGYVFVTYAWGTTERLLTENQTQYHSEVVAQMWPRMLARAVLFTVGLFLVQDQANIAVLAALSIPYISGAYRRRALITDLAVTLGTMLIIVLVLR